MVFSSLTFLFLFLPVSVLLYWCAPTLKLKNLLLTLLSLVFYAWGEPVWVVLLVFSAALDYTAGRMIGHFRGQWLAKAAIIVSITVNLGLLAVFKYLNFFLQNAGLLIGVDMPFFGITLPIGISFYTFQTLSYSIDVYKNKVNVQKSFVDFLLFVSLFPQLIAGPILRYSDLEAQLRTRKTTWEGMAAGISRFACGLGKKVLIANVAGKLAAGVLDGGMDGFAGADAWFGMLMFTAQIYFDFSGYSDMAIGLGKMFGFSYSENFRYPYIAVSITDFWRRWHISLSSFFRDYVYIPLGGNRKHQVVNLFIVWSLTGLWHGASWNFVLWGLYYFILLTVEKFFISRFLEKQNRFISWMFCFFFVVLGWSLFYYTDLFEWSLFIKTAFGFGVSGWISPHSMTLWAGNIPLLLICIVGSTPVAAAVAGRLPQKGKMPAAIAYNIALLALCTLFLAGQSYNPFLYFRF